MEQLLFTPLATPPSRAKHFLTSTMLQVSVVAALLGVGAMAPKTLPEVSRYVAINLIAPTPTPVPQAPQVRLHIKPSPIPPPTHVLTAPVRPVEDRPMPPQVEVQAFNKMPDVVNNIAAPKPTLNNFGSSAPQTTTKPAIKVQTGGFGDINGVKPDPNAHRPATIAAAGSFDLPQGTGHGNGLGGRTPGVTASTGFGNGTAVSPTGRVYRVTPSNFDDHVVLDDKTPIAVQVKTVPPQIISKPQPQYTEEGRRLKIEGAVRLELKLTADGQVEVLNVISKLGHGLDEQAVRVAQQIKFTPAKLEGRNTDSTVVVSIIFQLAS